MGKWIFLVFLVWAVWQDLRSRTVGQGFLAAAGSLGAAVSLLSGRSVLGLLSSVAVGIFLLILGQITDGGIGEGDGWFFIVTGFFLEPTENFMLFFFCFLKNPFSPVYKPAYFLSNFIRLYLAILHIAFCTSNPTKIFFPVPFHIQEKTQSYDWVFSCI